MTGARALVLALGLALGAAVNVAPFVGRTAAAADLTSDEQAANGPLPGDVTLYASELNCLKAHAAAGYYASLNAAEVADAERTGVYPCADFTGSFTGPNRVFAWPSEGTYQGAYFLNNRKPGELYPVGGVAPALTGPVAPGPYVAKVDATTGRQVWRTYLENANVSHRWIAVTNLNILPDGNIVVAWTDKVAIIDGDSGLILKSTILPTGDAAVENASFKHVTIAPDGTLILKDQSRPAGETGQGSLAVSQSDPSRMVTIFPFGPLKKGEISFAPPKNGTDIENNMLYAADMGMGKVAGIKLDQATGAMTASFVVNDTTTGFQPLVGPKDKRVLVISNIRRDVRFEGTMLELMTHLYTEQITWRDAATGRILAASDFFAPMQPNALITPGFGDRFYYITNKGFIVLQVKGGE